MNKDNSSNKLTRDSVESLTGFFADGEIGNRIRFIAKTDSTNRVALSLPSAEAFHGLVLVAREQTAGRGRGGRSWLSVPDVGIHFTVVLRPDAVPAVQLLNLTGALAVYDALAHYCEAPLDIRWPNDVLLGARKVSGILGEATFVGSDLERVALGISVNIAHGAEHFSGVDMLTEPTSILLTEGTAPRPESFLRKTLENLNLWYLRLVNEGAETIISGFRSRSSYVSGRRLTVMMGNDKLDVTSAGINEDGTLQVRLPSGAELKVLAGDIRILK